MTDKEKMLLFCNIVFKSSYDDFSKIEDNGINYTFHFTQGEEKSVRIISIEVFDELLDAVNRELIEKGNEEHADYMNPSDYEALTDDP